MPLKRENVIVLLVVFIFAIAFRVTFLDVIEFKGDEALLTILASRPLFGHPFTPGATVSSVAIMNPPLINYILLPFIVVSRNPQIISMLVGLLNSFAIVFFFLTVKKYYNLKLALFSSLMLALSPWAIIYSRKIWNPDFIFPIFIVTFYSTHKLLIEKKTFFWIPLITSFLFLIQIHLINIFFCSLLFFFLLKKAKTNIKNIVVGTLIGVLPLLPYLIFQVQNGCPDCTAFLDSRNRLSTNYSLLLFLRSFQITGIGDFAFILGEDFLSFKQFHFLIPSIIKTLWLPYLLMPLGAFFFYKDYKKLRIWIYIVILVSLIYFIFKIETLMHYFIIILPLLFLFIGFFFSHLTDSKNRLKKFGAYFLFLLIIFSYFFFDLKFFNFLQNEKTINGDYGQVYSFSSKEFKKSLSKYKNDSHYEEMFLTSYVPRFIFQGDFPMAKIFFDREVTKKNLGNLEKRLLMVPEDYRVQNELIAYYSNSIVTIEDIKSLRKKSEKIPGYYIVYNELYRESYLNRGHKKEHNSTISKISFAYPEHWKVAEEKNIITLIGDGMVLKISRDPIGKEIKLKNNPLFVSFSKENSTTKEIIESIREH